MDSKHKLDAPHNETLKEIEQLSDRSGLSTIYRSAHEQWEGELVTTAERERRRQHEADVASFGIRKKFWYVGLIAPLPLVLLSAFIGAAFAVVTEDNAPRLVIPALLLFLVWGLVSFSLLKKTFEIFYAHGMRALPFIVTLVIMLGFSLQSIYLLTIPLHSQQLLSAVAIVSTVELLWSIILSYGLILLWTTPRLHSNAKVGIIALFATALLSAAVWLTFLY